LIGRPDGAEEPKARKDIAEEMRGQGAVCGDFFSFRKSE